MSKRKRKTKTEKHLSVTSYPAINKKTGKMEMKTVTREIDDSQVESMKLYMRAHDLMMRHEKETFDEYMERDPVGTAYTVLANPDAVHEEDTLLEAIGTLGHLPTEKALATLSQYANSAAPLAPVAELALAECAMMHGGLPEEQSSTFN